MTIGLSAHLPFVVPMNIQNDNCQMEKEFTLLRSAFEEAYIKDEQMACILFVF